MVICEEVVGAWVVGIGYGGKSKVEAGGGIMKVGGGVGTSEGIGGEIAGEGSELIVDFSVFFGLDFSIFDLDQVFDDDFVFEDVCLGLVMVDRG